MKIFRIVLILHVYGKQIMLITSYKYYVEYRVQHVQGSPTCEHITILNKIRVFSTLSGYFGKNKKLLVKWKLIGVIYMLNFVYRVQLS